jgi:hypothetical protein
MDRWVVINKIKNGTIRYLVGDEVVIFRRKGKYPSLVEDGVVYTILNIENDFLTIRKRSLDEHEWLHPIKVHKTYMIHPCELRDIKLDILFR